MINEKFLRDEYEAKGCSVSDISKKLNCSQGKVNYWLSRFEIPKRSISEAVYLKNNPNGDPFAYSAPSTQNEWFLYGMGLGLFWGEGNKMNKNAVRLGNTDPDLILVFLKFLKQTYKIKESKLRFGLQIFSDMSSEAAKDFWCKKLSVKPSQFQKVIVTESGSIGTYRNKTRHGVLTVYFSNTKLRDIIMNAIEKLRKESKPT